MTRESFLETIRNQYAETVQEAYLESLKNQGLQVNFPALCDRLKTLINHAEVEGLPRETFEDLVISMLPEVTGIIDLSASSALRRNRGEKPASRKAA